ncbi:MAG: hypothetical protein AB1730_21245 [Myxococcota bacterium]|jgi:hypothetical protein
MKTLLLVIFLLVSCVTASGCAGMRSSLASASARHIPGCAAEEIEASNTYGANPFSGPSWKATCRGEVYECTGYPQAPDTVKCRKLVN